MEITIKNNSQLNKSLLAYGIEKYHELNNIPISLYY